jgi:hypothetical protein
MIFFVFFLSDKILLCQKTELRVFIGAEVESGGNVPQPHGVVPVDVPARPFDAGHLQTPKGAGLLHYTTTLINNNAENKTIIHYRRFHPSSFLFGHISVWNMHFAVVGCVD